MNLSFMFDDYPYSKPDWEAIEEINSKNLVEQMGKKFADYRDRALLRTILNKEN